MRERTKSHLSLTRLSDVEIHPVRYKFGRRLLEGKVNAIIGKGGMGKSTLVTHLASCTTKGRPMPGDTDAPDPANVLCFSIEDDVADTHLPRLLAEDGDPERYIVSKGTIHYDDEGNPIKGALSLVHTSEILDAIVMTEPRLLIIDPVTSFLGAGVDMHRANEVRPVLEALGDIAQETSVAVLLVLHINKGGTGDAMYRALGSVDFANTARSVLVTGMHEGRRVLAHAKINVTCKAPSLYYDIVDSHLELGGYPVGRIEWGGEAPIGADELEADTRQKPGPAPVVDQLDLENHILTALDAPLPASTLEKRTREDLGASRNAFERARANLRNAGKIDFRNIGYGNGATYYWHRADVEAEAWEAISHKYPSNSGDIE